MHRSLLSPLFAIVAFLLRSDGTGHRSGGGQHNTTPDARGIEEGKIADLVLLEANPLEDIRNTRKIYAVILGGKMVQKPSS